ncbi:MAG: ABC transporter ATP-binding protein [Planctomycetota bacterium]|jgi:multiple sugar transport system ATP-binding protein
MSEVALNNVSKTYESGVHAVRGFDLDIADGEFMVLVGPSGSGKSTVLRMIAGLEEITAGEVRIGDRVANLLHPKDRDVAMVFQDYALYPHMSVAENIGFSLGLRRVRKEEISRRVGHVAELLGLGELLDRKPRALSGGQQQRVALGRAIVREPAVFLFDEPLSNLDARLRITTRSEIKALQRRLKATVIYVTHDQEEAMTLGDRVAVIVEGRLQQVGTPLQLYRNPENRFVASFIGSPPMSFLDGRIERSNSRPVFVEGLADTADPADHLAVPEPWHAGVEPFVGRHVVLGLRPQALSERGEGPAGRGECTLSVGVEHVETLGPTMDVFCSTRRGGRVVARLAAREDFPASGIVTLRLDMEQVHPFAPGAFGRNLLLPE